MKEKDDKLRLVKQILVDDEMNPIPSAPKERATATPSCTEATPKASDYRSRRVSSIYC